MQSLPLETKAKLWRFSHSLGIAMLCHVVVAGLYARCEFGRDHLCNAAYRGGLGEIRFLLDAGADPSRVGWDEHLTPLGAAAVGGQLESARLLLEWGADPNTPSDSRMTAIGDAMFNWGKPIPSERKPVIALLRSAGGRYAISPKDLSRR